MPSLDAHRPSWPSDPNPAATRAGQIVFGASSLVTFFWPDRRKLPGMPGRDPAHLRRKANLRQKRIQAPRNNSAARLHMTAAMAPSSTRQATGRSNSGASSRAP